MILKINKELYCKVKWAQNSRINNKIILKMCKNNNNNIKTHKKRKSNKQQI